MTIQDLAGYLFIVLIILSIFGLCMKTRGDAKNHNADDSSNED